MRSATRSMPDWASLQPDLVSRVADCLLATNDLDYYMDLRVVCSSWRSATADPKATPGDPRFRPRRWIMLDEHGSDDDDDDKTTRRLFVNAATVRFLRRDVRQLRSLSFVATTAGGLLVLAEREPPQAARVLNPFTRSLTRFMAPVPPERFVAAEVVGASSSSSTLVLVPLFSDTVYWADAGSERFCSEKHGWLSPSTRLPIIAARYGGGAGEQRRDDDDDYAEASKILETRLLRAGVSCWSYVVDTADGYMLIILKAGNRMDVYRMDSAGAKVKRVRNIGSRAVFLGARCLVVDAGKLASMELHLLHRTSKWAQFHLHV
ncbi:hypothetical protein ACP70R_017300 [Stipagrostis hirtigluma subsp. patula]